MLGILGSGRPYLSPMKGLKTALFRPVQRTALATLHGVNLPAPRPPHRRALRRAFRHALAACTALAWLPTAHAQLSLAAVPPADLARALALVSEAAARLAPPAARIQALPGALDTRLQLAPCGRVDPYLPTGVPAWGRTRVGLRCADGSARWNVLLPVTVQVWAPAVVAGAALPAGAALADSPLQTVESDWGAAPSPLFSAPQALAGRQLSRPVAEGQPLRQADLLQRQWFAAGETVKVVASGAGYAVSSEGVALAAGHDGQAVRVRLAGDRTVVGRAVAERQVEVGP